jgi:competence protein ComEC
MSVTFLYNRNRFRGSVLVALALIMCAIGIERMNVAALSGSPVFNAHIGERVTLTGYVFAEPDVREDSTRISLRVRTLSVGNTATPVHAGVLVVVPPHTHIAYGDEVEVSGILRIPEAFDTGTGRSFNYPAYLAMSGITYQLTSAHVDTIGKNDGNTAYAWVIRFKSAYLEGLHAVLPEPESGLAGGITVGDKRSIGPELTAEFQRVSLIHMLVLSGYNITIILNAVSSVLSHTPSILQFASSGFVVIFFIALSGGASSAVRAGAMAMIAVYARRSHRIYVPLRAIVFVAAMMALWNPYVVAFDPGFQLSVLATVGLIAYTPLFAAHLQWLTEAFGMREIAASTLATQLTVLPLLLYQNGQLSIVALPANIMALAPVPFAMAASAIAALSGFVFDHAATVIAWPAYALLSYIIAVTHIFAVLPFASVSIGTFGVGWLIVSYSALFIMWYYIRDEHSRA